jgi:F-type H+-transporting ATPase subunit delta
MVNEKLARRYAVAAFSLAQTTGAADRVGDDVARIAATIREDASVADFFVAPTVDRRDKERVLRDAFAGRVDDVALHTVLLLVRKRREAMLDAIVTEYRKLQMSARGAEAVTIRTARALSDDELRGMADRLQRIYGKKFEVTQLVDPKLIGGVRVLMGDRRIDGSVLGRLESLSRELFATT